LKSVTQRIQLSQRTSEPCRQLVVLHAVVEKAAADAGLDQRLIELVKIRGSMLNGCPGRPYPAAAGHRDRTARGDHRRLAGLRTAQTRSALPQQVGIAAAPADHRAQ
jgi:hypothetical protein